MIKGIFERNGSGMIKAFTLTGHADAGPYGSDIVCAAASVLAINAVNSIEALAGLTPKVDLDEENGGYMKMELTSRMTQEQSNISQILLESLLLGLQAIQNENLEFIQVSTATTKA